MPGKEVFKHRAEKKGAATLEGALITAQADPHAAAERDRAAPRHAPRDRLDAHRADALQMAAHHRLVVSSVKTQHLAQRCGPILLVEIGEREIVQRKVADAAPRDGAIEDWRDRPRRHAEQTYRTYRRRGIEYEITLASSGHDEWQI